MCSFLVPSGVWLSSVARSCATWDESNKDIVCTSAIPAGINRPPPSETISHIPRVPNYKTRNTLSESKGFLLGRGTLWDSVFIYIYDGEVGRRIRSTAEGEASPLGEQLE